MNKFLTYFFILILLNSCTESQKYNQGVTTPDELLLITEQYLKGEIGGDSIVAHTDLYNVSDSARKAFLKISGKSFFDSTLKVISSQLEVVKQGNNDLIDTVVLAGEKYQRKTATHIIKVQFELNGNVTTIEMGIYELEKLWYFSGLNRVIDNNE